MVAESAKRGAERVAFNQMFDWVRASARKDGIKVILAHKLDRVCRNMRDAVRLQELEDQCGVQLAFVDNQFGPGAAGALSFNVMAAVAQYYSDNLRGEVLKGIDEKYRQGWPNGFAPFGYLNVKGNDEPIQPHPVESKALMRIFEMYSSGHYTFEAIGDRLASEGFVYRPSQPRFNRTVLSYILNNRFYIGELHRNGCVHQGKYRLLVDRETFEICQDVLHGRNRRTGNLNHNYAGGLFRCAFCGFALTGERIRRRLLSGGIHEHQYYRCANNHPDEKHLVVRWPEERLNEAIVHELETLRMPDPQIAAWFRTSVERAFEDVWSLERQRQQSLAKRKTELAGMQDRLLNGYLAGAIDEAVFQAKNTDLKRQSVEVADTLAQANAYDPAAPARALALLDFSQDLVDIWRGSNSAVRREILDCVSLNHRVSDVSLVLEKRKPFDFLVERPFLKKSRGDWI